jgi:hypothetical protein
MPDSPDAQEKESSQPSENIEIPPIPKQTAGAVAGAAVGSIAGPIGAVVGGVVGAVAGKAAEKRRPIAPAARRTVRKVVKRPKAISKAPSRRRPNRKSVARSRKAATSSRGKAKREYRIDQRRQNHAKVRGLGEARHCRGLLRNAVAVAENGISPRLKSRLAAEIPHFDIRFRAPNFVIRLG